MYLYLLWQRMVTNWSQNFVLDQWSGQQYSRLFPSKVKFTMLSLFNKKSFDLDPSSVPPSWVGSQRLECSSNNHSQRFLNFYPNHSKRHFTMDQLITRQEASLRNLCSSRTSCQIDKYWDLTMNHSSEPLCLDVNLTSGTIGESRSLRWKRTRNAMPIS